MLIRTLFISILAPPKKAAKCLAASSHAGLHVTVAKGRKITGETLKLQVEGQIKGGQGRISTVQQLNTHCQ